MNKQELIKQLERCGMRPGRGLGQNFLLDRNLLEWIVRKAAPQKDENILEVGPGFGALTELLVATGANVTAVEYDHRIAEHLRKRFAGAENRRLIEADACKVDYSELFPDGTPFRCVANLPYAISTVFIAKLCQLDNGPESMLFMLQKEMGERLASPCNCKSYGALTVTTQSIFDVVLEKVVPPEVFYPPPEVESALVSFTRHERFNLDSEGKKHLSTMVRLLFNQRRKQMGKVLCNGYPKEKVQSVLETMGIPATERVDKVPVEQLVNMSELFYRK
ncbi:MAG: ribosomal RNA small subunit methyltransferase A [Lentisphaeria bacterium]|nr:ribosomal RNA small subunit methyltransferase A [Lentisphaeria bacterium]